MVLSFKQTLTICSAQSLVEIWLIKKIESGRVKSLLASMVPTSMDCMVLEKKTRMYKLNNDNEDKTDKILMSMYHGNERVCKSLLYVLDRSFPVVFITNPYTHVMVSPRFASWTVPLSVGSLSPNTTSDTHSPRSRSSTWPETRCTKTDRILLMIFIN